MLCPSSDSGGYITRTKYNPCGGAVAPTILRWHDCKISGITSESICPRPSRVKSLKSNS